MAELEKFGNRCLSSSTVFSEHNMPFGLTIGTERAAALQVCCLYFEMDICLLLLLQQSIQNELTKRGYSPDAGSFVIEFKVFFDLGVSRSCYG